MKRSAMLFALLLSFTLNTRATDKPDIIFIMVDDVGCHDLGCLGRKTIQTPDLDRLATEGIRFTDCYSGATVCAPARSRKDVGKYTGHPPPPKAKKTGK